MTLDDSVLRAIEDTVRDFVESGRMFTAFDVSLAVKSQGIQARHRHMREAIHECIDEHATDGADYTRTLRDVGAPTKAWVYHPWEEDAAQYRPVDRGAPSTGSSSTTQRTGGGYDPLGDSHDDLVDDSDDDLDDTASSSHADPWGSGKATVDGAFVPDHTGQLTIPLNVLQSIGIRAGATVKVAYNINREEIVLWQAGSSMRPSQGTMQVDHDGSLRISEQDLGRAGLEACLCYRIVGHGQELSIRDLS